MNPKTKKVLGIILFICLMIAAAFLRKMRSTSSHEARRQERLSAEIGDSISKSLEGIKFCPASEPNCAASPRPTSPPTLQK